MLTSEQFSNKEKIKIALIGLGPHAERIYLKAIMRYKLDLRLVIDLESQKDRIGKLVDCTKYFVNDNKKDREQLAHSDKKALSKLIHELGITHAIIASEPKAHFAYASFFLGKFYTDPYG